MCLCCEKLLEKEPTQSSIQQLKVHTLSSQHLTNARQFLNSSATKLFLSHRYSCQSCLIYFKNLEDLLKHSSSQLHGKDGARLDPLYMCHLCDVSKASVAKFTEHCMGNQHNHKLSRESEQHPSKYGIQDSAQYYACQTCQIAASFSSTLKHLKEGVCKEVKCGPCNYTWLSEGQNMQELKMNLRQHVLLDSHTNCVERFVSLPSVMNQFNTEYSYRLERGFLHS